MWNLAAVGCFVDAVTADAEHRCETSVLAFAVMSDPRLARSPLLTIPELATRLRISKSSAYRVAKEMPHVAIRGRVLVPELALERYIEERLREPDTFSTVTSPRPRLSRAAPSPRAAPNLSWLRPIQPRTKPKQPNKPDR